MDEKKKDKYEWNYGDIEFLTAEESEKRMTKKYNAIGVFPDDDDQDDQVNVATDAKPKKDDE